MVAHDIELLKKLGLSEAKAKETIRNSSLFQTIQEICNQYLKYGNIDKNVGILLYTLASCVKPQINQHVPIILQYISDGKITSTSQISTALKYFLQHSSQTSTTNAFDSHAFEKACGIGIIVSKAEIENLVDSIICKLINSKDANINNIGFIIREVKSHLPWADGKCVKDIVTVKTQNFRQNGHENFSSKKTKENVNKSKEIPSSVTTDSAKISTLSRNYLDLYKNLGFHKPGENYMTDGYVITPNTKHLLAEHLARTGGRVITRFPPEPNGILHIGHAKAINIDFGYAKANDGLCYLRYDDTNPEKEEEKFFLGIEEMVRWLGYKPWKITHSSDYFQRLYECAVELIHKGLAYVCHQSADEMKGFDPKPSPWRTRNVDENLILFNDMKHGKIDEGKATLRMKVRLEEGKIDPVAYRIKFVPHHRTGNEWCIYPTYDFTHCLCDSFEDITHSLCTKEFQSRRSSYYWLCNALDLYCPVQWEYGRLNLTHSVVSKRKIAKLIESKCVRDWDDPRLYTLTGLRRRGYPPEAINKFCASLGVTTALTSVDIEMLESFVRDESNESARRVMAILEPCKITIVNWNQILDYIRQSCKPECTSNMRIVVNPKDSSNSIIELTIPHFPNQPEKGTYITQFGPSFYIDLSDFDENNTDPGFKRLTMQQGVGLRYINLILHVDQVIRFENNNAAKTRIKELRVRAEPVTPENKKSVKGYIQWVYDPLIIEVRLYEKLFKHANPENPQQVPEGFLSDINEKSEHIIPHALVDRSVAGVAAPFEKFQFERIGYFSVDPDTTSKKLVFNRCVTLKEDPKKL